MKDAVKLLDATLAEEKAADQKLTDLALSQENVKAAA
jgi:ferritin-like metal-binding protein YciE